MSESTFTSGIKNKLKQHQPIIVVKMDNRVIRHIPDLLIYKESQLFMFEIKRSEKEKARLGQIAYLNLFRKCGAYTGVINPSNWNLVYKQLVIFFTDKDRRVLREIQELTAY